VPPFRMRQATLISTMLGLAARDHADEQARRKGSRTANKAAASLGGASSRPPPAAERRQERKSMPRVELRTVAERGFSHFEAFAARSNYSALAFMFKPLLKDERLQGMLPNSSLICFSPNVPGTSVFSCACPPNKVCGPRCKSLVFAVTKRVLQNSMTQKELRDMCECLNLEGGGFVPGRQARRKRTRDDDDDAPDEEDCPEDGRAVQRDVQLQLSQHTTALESLQGQVQQLVHAVNGIAKHVSELVIENVHGSD